MKNRFYLEVFKTARGKYLFAIIVEIVIYCSCFLLSGIFRRDIFNHIENVPKTFSLGLGPLILLTSCLPLLTNCIKQANAYIMTSAENTFVGYIRKKLYLVIEKMPMKKEKNTENFMTYFKDDTQEVVDLLSLIYGWMPRFIMSIGALIIMFISNPFYASVALIPIIVNTVVAKKFNHLIGENRKANRAANSEALGQMGEILDCAALMKTVPSMSFAFEKFKHKESKRQSSAIHDVMYSEFFNIISKNVMNIALGIILLVCTTTQNRGGLTVGDIVMFQYYFNFVTSIPRFFSSFIKQRKQSDVSLNRLIDATDGKILQAIDTNEQSKTENQPCEKWHVEIGKIPFVPNLSERTLQFDVQEGSLTVVCGETGTGKTAVLQALIGLYGDYCNTGGSGAGYLSAPISAFVPQIPTLFNDTLLENVCLGSEYNAELFKQAAVMTTFDVDLNQLNNGSQTIVGNYGSQLSGGQRKRVAYMRALYMQPKILIIDDFGAGLDEITKKQIMDRVLEQKYTCIISSNDKAFLRIADTIIDLDNINKIAVNA